MTEKTNNPGLVGCWISLMSVVTTPTLAATPEFQSRSEQQIFRDFALAACVHAAYKDAAVRQDSARAQGGYLEFGHMPMDAYEAVQALLPQWLDKHYVAKQGGEIQLMKCVDFQQSSEVGAIYQRFNPCLDRQVWDDVQSYHLRCPKP